jgi:hypothetical protein
MTLMTLMTVKFEPIEPTTDFDNGQQPTKPRAATTATWQLPEAV